MRALLALFCGLALGLAFGAWHWRDPALTNYPATRAAYVRNLIAQSGPVDTLALGDSITELTLLEGACGRTFNAATGGPGVRQTAQLARYAIARLHPKTVILAVGANDFTHGPAFGFERAYRELAISLPGKRILVGIPNSATASRFVHNLAGQLGARYVEPVTGNLTSDGVHPTPKGALAYRRRLDGACR